MSSNNLRCCWCIIISCHIFTYLNHIAPFPFPYIPSTLSLLFPPTLHCPETSWTVSEALLPRPGRTRDIAQAANVSCAFWYLEITAQLHENIRLIRLIRITNFDTGKTWCCCLIGWTPSPWKVVRSGPLNRVEIDANVISYTRWEHFNFQCVFDSQNRLGLLDLSSLDSSASRSRTVDDRRSPSTWFAAPRESLLCHKAPKLAWKHTAHKHWRAMTYSVPHCAGPGAVPKCRRPKDL